MKHQITRISVHQTAKVIAVVYGVLGIVLVPIFWVVTLVDPTASPAPFWLLIVFPLLYAGLGYVFTAIGVAIYNAIAGRVGGIEVTLTQVDA